MLTTMYYYNLYRPYIVKENGNTTKAKKINTKVLPNENDAKNSTNSTGKAYSYLLNKSIKTDLVAYATEISEDVNNIKDIAKFMVGRFSGKNKNGEKKGKSDFADGLEDFTNQVNEFDDFLNSTKRESPALNRFGASLNGSIEENQELFSKLGIKSDENGKLSFDREAFENISDDTYTDTINKTKSIFENIYKKSCDVMKLPMSEHMNFRELNNYYNYTYAPKDANSFKMLETGMIVDIML